MHNFRVAISCGISRQDASLAAAIMAAYSGILFYSAFTEGEGLYETKAEETTHSGAVVLHPVASGDYPPCSAGNHLLPSLSGQRLCACLRAAGRTACSLCIGTLIRCRRRTSGTLHADWRHCRRSDHAVLFPGAGADQRRAFNLCDHVHIRLSLGHEAALVPLSGSRHHARCCGRHFSIQPSADAAAFGWLCPKCAALRPESPCL